MNKFSIGDRIGKLIIRQRLSQSDGYKKTIYYLKCDCGNTCLKDSSALNRLVFPSCGCENPKNRSLLGHTYGRLKVLAKSSTRTRKRVNWLCRCSCGNINTYNGDDLIVGDTKSCGCLNIDKLIERSTTHGKRHTEEYIIWAGMKARTVNPNNDAYQYYGAKGISVCDRWFNSFENFLEDMGKRPTKQHSIERLDSTKDYSPDNCVWATVDIQANNKPGYNRTLTIGCVTLTVAQWAKELSKDAKLIYGRLDRGWSDHDALFKPVRKSSK